MTQPVEKFTLQTISASNIDESLSTSTVNVILESPAPNTSIAEQAAKFPSKPVTNSPKHKNPEKLELYHSVSSAINTTINTIGTEIAKLRVKSVNSDKNLDERELKALNDFFKALMAYEAHQAALVKQEALTGKLGELTDEELLAMVDKTLKDNSGTKQEEASKKPAQKKPAQKKANMPERTVNTPEKAVKVKKAQNGT
jgi:hypothetical protein